MAATRRLRHTDYDLQIQQTSSRSALVNGLAGKRELCFGRCMRVALVKLALTLPTDLVTWMIWSLFLRLPRPLDDDINQGLEGLLIAIIEDLTLLLLRERLKQLDGFWGPSPTMTRAVFRNGGTATVTLSLSSASWRGRSGPQTKSQGASGI